MLTSAPFQQEMTIIRKTHNYLDTELRFPQVLVHAQTFAGEIDGSHVMRFPLEIVINTFVVLPDIYNVVENG